MITPKKHKNNIFLLSCIALLIISFLGSWILKDHDDKILWVANSTYYILSSLFFTWIYYLFKYLKDLDLSLKKMLSNQKIFGIILAIILTILTAYSTELAYKVLSDEANILGIAKSLYYDQTIYNGTMGLWYYDSYHPILEEFPKRPFFFPYLISIVHSFLGYSDQNAIYLNLSILFSLLCLVFLVLNRWRGLVVAILGVFLVWSHPILSLCASSSGFDLASLFFSCLSLLFLYLFLKEKTLTHLRLFWLTTCIFAQIRYESLIYLFIFLTLLLLMKKISKDLGKKMLPYFLLTPLWILPNIAQIFLSQGKYEAPKGGSLFSFEHFSIHFLDFINKAIYIDLKLPFNQIIVNFGILASLFLSYLCLRKKSIFQDKIKFQWCFFFFVFFLTQQGLFFSHHFGFYTHPTQSRFYLSMTFFLSLSFLFFIELFAVKNKKLLLCFILFLTFLSRPSSNELYSTNQLTLVRKTRFILNYLRKNISQNNLIITSRPGRFTVSNYGAVNFPYANNNLSNILKSLKRKLFQKIIVIQEIKYKDGKAIPDEILNTTLKLRTVATQQITSELFLRISHLEEKSRI